MYTVNTNESPLQTTRFTYATYTYLTCIPIYLCHLPAYLSLLRHTIINPLNHIVQFLIRKIDEVIGRLDLN